MVKYCYKKLELNILGKRLSKDWLFSIEKWNLFMPKEVHILSYYFKLKIFCHYYKSDCDNFFYI